MAVSYKKLFKLMIDRDIKKKDMRELTGLSYGTLKKLENGCNVQMKVLNNICMKLHCRLSDIAEIVFEDEMDNSTAKQTDAPSSQQ